MRRILFVIGLAGIVILPLSAQPRAEAKDVVLVGHNDLNGNGDGGEGLAIQQWADGRRILYLAHEGQKTCLSIVDVTHPENPVMINQLPVARAGHHALQLARPFRQRAGDRQSSAQARARKRRAVGAGCIGLRQRIQNAKRLRISNSPSSIRRDQIRAAVHCVWFVDGEFAHLTTGAADFDPTQSQRRSVLHDRGLARPATSARSGPLVVSGNAQRRHSACLIVCRSAIRNSTTATGRIRPRCGRIIRIAPMWLISMAARSSWISPDSPT